MNKCSAEILLKQKNISPTKKRLAVMNLILDSTSPLSITEMYDLLKSRTSIDLATVYRITNRLKESNLVREINLKRKNSLYEKSCVHNPVHPHFICTKCGSVKCLKECNNEIEKNIKTMILVKNEIAKINYIDVEVKGICENCV